MGPKAFRFPTPKKWEEARSKEGENGEAGGGQGATAARPRQGDGRQQAVGTKKGLRFTSATRNLDQPDGVQEGNGNPGEQVEEEIAVDVGSGDPAQSSSSSTLSAHLTSSSAPVSGSIDEVSALGGQRTAVSIAPAQNVFEVQKHSPPPAPIDAERGDEKHGKGGEWRVERAPQGGGGGSKGEAGGETGAEAIRDESDDPIFDHAMAKMGADAAGKVLKSREMIITSVKPGFGV